MILFVGDKPSPKMKTGAKPFEGSACEKRLKEWIKAVTDTQYIIVNQTDEMYFNFFVSAMLLYNRPMIALGDNASKALGRKKHFKLPHPSGLNRQINDKAFINGKLAECKKYIESF